MLPKGRLVVLFHAMASVCVSEQVNMCHQLRSNGTRSSDCGHVLLKTAGQLPRHGYKKKQRRTKKAQRRKRGYFQQHRCQCYTEHALDDLITGVYCLTEGRPCGRVCNARALRQLLRTASFNKCFFPSEKKKSPTARKNNRCSLYL